MKLFSRLRLQFTYIKENKFGHGFNDTVNLMCPGGVEAETTEHFLLHCHCFSTQRTELFDNLYYLDSSFLKWNTKDKVVYLFYGPASYLIASIKILLNKLLNLLNQRVDLISHFYSIILVFLYGVYFVNLLRCFFIILSWVSILLFIPDY